MIISATWISCSKPELDDEFVKGNAPPVPGGYTHSSQISPTNLVAYWAFNGSLIDSVSKTLAIGTGTSFAAGLKSQALKVGGAKTYAIATPSDAVKSMTSYTVSIWYNSPQNVGATGIFSLADTKGFWGNINIFFENGGTNTKARVKTIYGDNGTTRDNAIQDINDGFNKWVNYTISYDGAGNFKSFVNGSPIRTRTEATMGPIRFVNVGSIVFGTLQFMTEPSSTAGTGPQSWAGYLSGQIDEVKIFNKGLTESEILALFKLERQGR